MSRRAIAGLGLLMTIALHATSASAQTAEQLARAQLIDQAQAARKAGDHKLALDLAERAAKIQLTPSLRSFLASEQEETGKIAEGFSNAQQCVREFERAGTLPKHDEYLAICKSIRDRLSKKVGYLVLKLDSVPPSLVVKVAGQVLNQALIGVRYPVTPGPVAVEAYAPGHYPFRTEITVIAGPDLEVKISLAPAATPADGCPAGKMRDTDGACVDSGCEVGFIRRGGECVPGTAGASSEPASGGLTIQISQSQKEAPPLATARHKRWGAGLGAAGLAALVASGITWGIAQSKFTSIRDECDRNECTDAEAVSGRNSVRTLDRVSVATGVVGGILLVGGTGMFFAGKW